jgi:N-methylhydantoinase B
MAAATAETARAGVELEILRHKLHAIAVEMGVPLARAAANPEIAEDRDHATCVTDRWGGVAALDNPLHLGPFARTAADVLNYFRFDMRDGDVVLSSDPYRGGTHVQDITLIRPYVVENATILYLAARGHVPDIGGQVAGGYFPSARELWAEGAPLTPLKLHRYDRPVRDVLTTVLLNSRTPEAVRRALDAMLAALELGRRRMDELVGGYGVEQVREALAYSQDYVERRVRAEIARWNDGESEGSAVLDHDGAGGPPVTVRATARVAGEELELDFSASDEQRSSFVNSAIANTESFALVPVLTLLGDDVWPNSGVLRAVRVHCEPGKVANPAFPAPVGWSGVHCGAEIAEAAARALHTPADAGYGALTVPRSLVACRPAHDRDTRVDLAVWGFGGASAAAGADAWGRPSALSRAVIPSVEQWEARQGMRVRGLEFVEDSAGAGRWRGAPGVEAHLELPADQVYTLCVEGREHPAQPTAGGEPGGPAALLLDAGDAPATLVEQPLDTAALRLRVGGGAGFGDPLSRDPEAVLADVLDGIVSAAAAAERYGVVVTAEGVLDEAATAARREQRSE